MFDWSKLIEVAEHLANVAAKQCNEEACYRSSTSRSYYAAFCMAKNYIFESEKINFNSGGAHTDIRKHMRKSDNETKRRIANQLKDLHYDRIKADYWNECNGNVTTRTIAMKAITMSKKILDELHSLKD